MTEYICILDFEATCWYDNSDHEIIEFPSVLLRWQDSEIKEVSRFQQFVKPLNNPIVSDFCTELTGITQKQIDHGIDLKSTVEAHLKWITGITNQNNVTIVTCGDWDMNKMLPRDLKNISYVPNKLYARYVNIKELFRIAAGIKGTSMLKMLKHINMDVEGRHHSGIDDCHNIARIFIELVKKGLGKQNILDSMQYVAYDMIRHNMIDKKQKYVQKQQKIIKK
jgi:ERI1 exoribonuclease 3